MLGKYTKGGGRLPELHCLPSVEWPRMRRAYFPNSPCLSGLQARGWCQAGTSQGHLLSPNPLGHISVPSCHTGDPEAPPWRGESWWRWGFTRVTQFVAVSSCLGLKRLASHLWYPSWWSCGYSQSRFASVASSENLRFSAQGTTSHWLCSPSFQFCSLFWLVFPGKWVWMGT